MTRRQKDLFDFISAYIAENEISPSYEEMMTAIGVKSKSRINALVKNLEERGMINRIPYCARAIRIVEDDEPSRSMILAGQGALNDFTLTEINDSPALVAVHVWRCMQLEK